ncbi:hypothetical protein FOZ62_016668, partial [Perkinsus olseni]
EPWSSDAPECKASEVSLPSIQSRRLKTTPVEASSGSGCLLSLPQSAGPSWRSRNFVLTAAHVVADSIYLTVQRNTDYFEPNKFPAVVRAVCHDSDLALVE